MKILVTAVLLVIATLMLASPGVMAQGDTLPQSPFVTFFRDTTFTTTYNGQPVPVGSIITAFDQSDTWCGIDTVTVEGTYGFMGVVGDDSQSPEDEGADPGEQIKFKINGLDATVNSGDDTFTDKAQKSVSLSANTVTVAMAGINFPSPIALAPGDTGMIKVDVRNDGNGTDFYGVNLTMSIDDTVSNPGNFDWKKIEPDTVVYADPGETASVYFSIAAPLFSSDTVNVVSYSVYSNIDTSVTVDGTVDVFMSITDVDDPDLNLPGSFTLAQNYPNPFNPSTTIAFNLSSRTQVRFQVFDVLGRVVESRELGTLPAGPHEIEYEPVGQASGVYFYRLITESMAETKKMVLIK